MDLEDLEYVMGSLKLLGSKGTTGTQASFLELFDGDQETIDKIDPMIAAKMGKCQCRQIFVSICKFCKYCGKCTQDVK